ncbi:hypothetical protein BU072_12290 [Mammaliicoccus vitulinus]|uniref:Uncharacterized protein n=1 Tax=Mammaliicoccus vitulinus TaxID=71237 RepID=A0A2T4PQP5_9STAP|nr:DUF5079 family protein [Mammaliicoccus vitulinus]PTI28148.1 hypothetical protein BU072_12290 [Mammaliicoccus vitulinus]
MLIEHIRRVKRAYITPASIIVNLLISIFYIVPYFNISSKSPLPLYLKIFFGVWIACVILSLVQEKNVAKVKKSRLTVIRYLIVDILGAYIMPLSVSTIYVFGSELMGFEAFDIWLTLVLCIFLSWLGMHMFLCSEFKIGVMFKSNLFKLIGIILIIGSLVYTFYLGLKVPLFDVESNKYIWLSMITIGTSHLFMFSPYVNFGLYLTLIEDEADEADEEGEK